MTAGGKPVDDPGGLPAPAIAIFVHDLGATGVVRNAIAIANRLAADGLSVALLVCRATGELRGEIASGVRLVELFDDQAARRRRSDLLRAVPKLRRYLRDYRPALLFSAGNHGHLACWAAARGMHGLRRIYRISNDIGQGRSALPLRARIEALRRRLKMALFARDADRLVLVSPHLLKERVFAAAQSQGRVSVIPNGVDVDMIRRRGREPCFHLWIGDRSMATIVAVGRLVPQKNYPNLLRALAVANRKVPVRLIILGAGKAKARRALSKLARSLGIEERVSLTGTVANPFAYLCRASAFVLPSWWEGASNVLLEALACETPVIASRTAGNAEEVLGGGRFGLLVDPGNIKAMACAIVQQVEEGRRPAGRAWAFDRVTALNAYSQLIRGLVEASPGPTDDLYPLRPAAAQWTKRATTSR